MKKALIILLALILYLNIGWVIGGFYYDNVFQKTPEKLTTMGKIAAGGWSWSARGGEVWNIGKEFSIGVQKKNKGGFFYFSNFALASSRRYSVNMKPQNINNINREILEFTSSMEIPTNGIIPALHREFLQ